MFNNVALILLQNSLASVRDIRTVLDASVYTNMYFEIAQKVIEGDWSHDGICMYVEKSITCKNSEMAHFFKFENSEMAKNESKNESNFKQSQNFRTKKVNHLRILTRDRYFELESILSHLKITCIFNHVTNLLR